MKKKLLFLTAWLLTGATCFNAYAQGQTGEGEGQEQEVDPTNIRSYEELRIAVDAIQKKSTLTKEQEQKQAKYDYWFKNPVVPKELSKEVTIEHINDVYTSVKAFYDALDGQSEDEHFIYYRLYQTYNALTTKKSYVVYITIPTLKNDGIDAVVTVSGQNKWIGEWKQVNMKVLLEKLGNEEDLSEYYFVNKPTSVGIIYRKQATNTIVSQKTALTLLEDEDDGSRYGNEAIFSAAVANAANILLTTYFSSDFYYIEKKDEKYINPSWQEWNDSLTAAKSSLDEIIGKVDAVEAFDNLTVTRPITVPNVLNKMTWPAGCTLDGGNNMVTGNLPLFAENNGTILNLIAPDGRIAENSGSGAKAKDCIVKVSGGWRVYDDEGNYASAPFTTLEDAVYAMRDHFGYDVKNGKATGKVEDGTKLYQAKYANANQKDVYSFKVNLGQTAEETFIYNTEDAPSNMKAGITLENSVIYLDNTDVPAAVKGVPNVVVRNASGKYVCSKMTLTEGMRGDAKTQEFYIPYDFSTDNLNYTRNVTTNTVAVCLPFALTDNIRMQLASKAGAGEGEAWFYTFKEIRGLSMFFNISDEIEANKPCLIAFKEGIKPGTIFDGLSVDFKSTENAVLASKSINENVTRFFGNYKAGQYAGDLAAMYADLFTGSAVYGFQGGELVKMNDKMVNDQRVGSKLHQFRSYVRHTEDLTAGTTPKSFRVCLLDENGDEVTGIGSVESDKNDNGFKAVGGNGVIELAAEKACGVKVYTAGGSLVKAVRVEAGNTVLPLSAGMYIVNQTKVVVK